MGVGLLDCWIEIPKGNDCDRRDIERDTGRGFRKKSLVIEASYIEEKKKRGFSNHESCSNPSVSR